MDRFSEKYNSAPVAFNFDDLILLPGFSETRPRDIDLATRFSKSIRIRNPFVSSPMDMVTESAMAIAMAESGGIGVVHRNCTAEDEVRMVRAVKEAEPKSATATLGSDKRLAVAAGISPFDLERAKALAEYADALMVDVAHFHTKGTLEATGKIISAVDIDVVIGSLGTKEGTLGSLRALEGAAGLRCGIGGGSICITTDVTKAGSPTLFATAQAADAREELGSDIPIIADGGIRSPGDMALAFAFGADSVMLGYGVAGTDESPGGIVEVNGRKFKPYRGMGSKGARERRAVVDRYADSGRRKMEEGIEGLIPYKGSVSDVIELISSGVRASIGYAGAGSIAEMRTKARIARIFQRTQKAGIVTK
ncbi:MAG: IMP dehydrogenase [Candidatus Marsarchaeota archaeon]|jgi:IMP dehydrogenase/GMP reductase|nr:IMP dehydrogenase [Candidatus Marsarchaeota archaeon]